MARQAFDNPALHVFYNRDFWFILPRGIIIMVLFLPVGHIFGRRHWRGCHVPDTMSEKTHRSGPDSVHLVEGLDLQVEKTDTCMKVYVVGKGKGVQCAD